MIRTDHAHVVATFHEYTTAVPVSIKKGLVDTACIALEIHAQIEEEIFYPAVAKAAGSGVLAKSVPEHNEMRRLISALRSMAPSDVAYDDMFMELMRDVLRHVADEETVLLPQAERLLPPLRLDELGAQMTERRLQLMLPRSGEILVNLLRATPIAKLALYSAAVLGIYVAVRRTTSSCRRTTRRF
jgi:iron-sulfur cluster repair protein YtfE (RIC family)